jgi:hypothetical protein
MNHGWVLVVHVYNPVDSGVMFYTCQNYLLSIGDVALWQEYLPYICNTPRFHPQHQKKRTTCFHKSVSFLKMYSEINLFKVEFKLVL